MLDKLTVWEVLTSIGVAELIESYTAFEMDKLPADHELINLSPDISILDRENPFASIATIALRDVPIIPSISPEALEVILTAFPTPLEKDKSSTSAPPPFRETPVPI